MVIQNYSGEDFLICYPVKCLFLYDGDEVVSPMLPMALNRGDVSPEARKFPVELTLNKSTSSSVLQLRIFDIDDMLNPLVRTNITNNTLIERDEF